MKRFKPWVVAGVLGLLLCLPSIGDTTPLGNPTRVYGKGQQHQTLTTEDSEHMAGRRTTDVSGVMYLEDAQAELIELGSKIPALKRRYNQLKGALPKTPRYEMFREAQRDLEGAQTRIRVLNGMIRSLKPRPKALDGGGLTTQAETPRTTSLPSEDPVRPEEPVEVASATIAKPEQSFSEGRMPEAGAGTPVRRDPDPLPWVVAILSLVLAISCVIAFIVYVGRRKPMSS